MLINVESKLNLPRLPMNLDYSQVRLQEISNGLTLIFYDDLERLNENDIGLVALHHNVDPDKLGIVIDEVRLINKPYIYNKASHIVHPSKIYIRSMNTKRYSKMLEDAISYFLETSDWSLFDSMILNPIPLFNEGWLSSTLNPVIDKTEQIVQPKIDSVKKDVKNRLIYSGLKIGGAVTAGIIGHKLSKAYAEKDKYAAPHERSQLIATLRALRGKEAFYENEYDKLMKRMNVANSNHNKPGLIRRIIEKIKAAIRAIINKLKGGDD